jgi:carboxypeptidase D
MITGLGGENVSLNIKHPDQDLFLSAGYEKIQTNGSYVGGMVRPAGPLSFSRVFEAGHLGSPNSISPFS